jgi:hypothetical protein
VRKGCKNERRRITLTLLGGQVKECKRQMLLSLSLIPTISSSGDCPALIPNVPSEILMMTTDLLLPKQEVPNIAPRSNQKITHFVVGVKTLISSSGNSVHYS